MEPKLGDMSCSVCFNAWPVAEVCNIDLRVILTAFLWMLLEALLVMSIPVLLWQLVCKLAFVNTVDFSFQARFFEDECELS